MDFVLRLAILVPVVFALSMIYAGQRHDNVKDMVHTALRLSFKALVSIAILLGLMALLEWFFIDPA